MWIPGCACQTACADAATRDTVRHTHTHIQRTTTTTTTTNMASLHEIEERTVPESLTLLDVGAGDPNRVVCAVWGCGLGFSSRALMTFWDCDWRSAEGSRMREPKKGPSFQGRMKKRGERGRRSAWTARFGTSRDEAQLAEGQAKAEGNWA